MFLWETMMIYNKHTFAYFLFFNIYFCVFVYLAVLGLSCAMRTLYLNCSTRGAQSSLWHVNSYLPRVGSRSLTRDQTWAACIGSTES